MLLLLLLLLLFLMRERTEEEEEKRWFEISLSGEISLFYVLHLFVCSFIESSADTIAPELEENKKHTHSQKFNELNFLFLLKKKVALLIWKKKLKCLCKNNKK